MRLLALIDKNLDLTNGIADVLTGYIHLGTFGVGSILHSSLILPIFYIDFFVEVIYILFA